MDNNFAVLVSEDGFIFDIVKENVSFDLANQVACNSTHWKIETYFNGSWEPLFSSEDL